LVVALYRGNRLPQIVNDGCQKFLAKLLNLPRERRQCQRNSAIQRVVYQKLGSDDIIGGCAAWQMQP